MKCWVCKKNEAVEENICADCNRARVQHKCPFCGAPLLYQGACPNEHGLFSQFDYTVVGITPSGRVVGWDGPHGQGAAEELAFERGQQYPYLKFEIRWGYIYGNDDDAAAAAEIEEAKQAWQEEHHREALAEEARGLAETLIAHLWASASGVSQRHLITRLLASGINEAAQVTERERNHEHTFWNTLLERFEQEIENNQVVMQAAEDREYRRVMLGEE